MATDAFLDKLSSDDTMLQGLDDTCVRSINGARVAIGILKLGLFQNWCDVVYSRLSLLFLWKVKPKMRISGAFMQSRTSLRLE